MIRKLTHSLLVPSAPRSFRFATPLNERITTAT
nr:MAG TPA: hypothetical protein [Caudoviricetes sp.]